MKTRLLTLLLLLGLPSLAAACSIPVFRYALERWELSPYEITVFYDKPLPSEVESLLKALDAGTHKVNVSVARVDVTRTMEPYHIKLWNRQGAGKTLPWISARLPETDAKLPDSWAGPCTVDQLRRLMDSPARQKLVEKLSQGTTAVFLLLSGADAEENAKAAAFLAKELPALAKRVELPEQGPDGPQIRFGVPLKVEFATLKLNRDDPAEEALVRTLLHSEEDLAKVRGPIVLPVFGRGRLLCSIHGEALTAKNLEFVVRFMCGPCSCEVKGQNPGQDLLIAADWLDLLDKAGPAVQEASSNVSTTLVAAAPVAVDTSSNVVVPPSVSATEVEAPLACGTTAGLKTWLVAGIIGAAVLALITGIWAFSQPK